MKRGIQTKCGRIPYANLDDISSHAFKRRLSRATRDVERRVERKMRNKMEYERLVKT